MDVSQVDKSQVTVVAFAGVNPANAHALNNAVASANRAGAFFIACVPKLKRHSKIIPIYAGHTS